jgi:hypothetical protein
MFIEKPYVAVNAPARVEFDLDRPRQQANRVTYGPIPATQPKKEPISEYQSRYKPIVDKQKPRTRKAFEAEQAEDRVNYLDKITI